MKKILIIPFLLTIYIGAFAQGGFIKPNNSYGTIWNRGNFDSTIYLPTGCGAASLRGYDLHKAAEYFDSCGSILYIYNPAAKTWSTVVGDTTGLKRKSDSTALSGYTTLYQNSLKQDKLSNTLQTTTTNGNTTTLAIITRAGLTVGPIGNSNALFLGFDGLTGTTTWQNSSAKQVTIGAKKADSTYRIEFPGSIHIPATSFITMPMSVNGYKADSLSGNISLPSVNISDTASMLAPYVQGSGTANYVPLFTGSRNLANSAIYNSSGNYGVGTATPYGSFEIRSNNSPNNSYSAGLNLNNRTVGTAAAGAGTMINFQGQSDLAYDRFMASSIVTWNVVSDATRQPKWIDYLWNAATSQKPAISRYLQSDQSNVFVGINKSFANQALDVGGRVHIDSIPTGAPTDNIVTQVGNILQSVPPSTNTTSASLIIDTVQTITQLENYTSFIKTGVNTIIVKDANRGGIFNHVTTGTPDSCTVFSCITGGFWQRQFKGYYHLIWSGADPTGSFDNTVLENYLLQTGLPAGATLYVDAGTGTYKDTGLVMTRAINIIGAGKVSSSFTCTLAGKDGLTIGANCSNFTIRDIALVGNGTASYGSDATNGNGIVFNTGAGISAGIYFSNVLIWHNGGDGIHSDNQGDINNIVFDNCTITNNKGAGVHLIGRNGASQINAITFKECIINVNNLDGMEVWGTSFNINNNSIESNKLRAILIDKRFLSAGYNLYDFNIEQNHFEGNDSGFVYMNVGSNIAFNTNIKDNYGLYDTVPGSSVNPAGINLYEFNSAAISGYNSVYFVGLNVSTNYSYSGTSSFNSLFNGNNILGYAATIAPAINILSQYINTGGAMLLYGNYYWKRTDTIPLSNMAQVVIKTSPNLGTTTAGDSLFFKKRIFQIASASTHTYNTDTVRLYIITAQASATTFANPTGSTSLDGTEIEIRLQDNGTSQTIAWGTAFVGNTNIPLPSATVVGKLTIMKLEYVVLTAKWYMVFKQDY